MQKTKHNNKRKRVEPKKCIYCGSTLKKGQLVECSKCAVILFEARREALLDMVRIFEWAVNEIKSDIDFLGKRAEEERTKHKTLHIDGAE